LKKTTNSSLVGRVFHNWSPGFRKIIGNTGWLLFDRVVRMGLGVFVGVWVARYLGPTQFGSLNFAISFVALFGTLTTFGLENIILREIVLDISKAPEILGTSFALRVCGSVIAPILTIITIHFVQPDDHVAVFLVSLLSVGLFFQAFDTIDLYFQSQVQSRLSVWAKNSAFLLMAGVRVTLIRLGAPLWTFAAAQVIELAIGAVGLIVAYTWSGGVLTRWRASRRRAIELLSQSWPVILSGMAIMIYMRIDMVMLKVMQGDRAAGIYAAATRVSEVWYFIPTAIVSSVSPSIIRARDNRVVYYARIAKLFSLMTLIAVVIGSIIALGSRAIIHLLYSDAFEAAAPVLAIHVWASVFVFLGVAQAPWDFSENLLKLGFYRTLSGAVSNVLLNLVLVPRYSAVGAAVATVVSYALSSVVANAFNSSTRPIFYLQMRSFILADMWSKGTSVREPHDGGAL
jgi:PST family polysaccharide transporter